MPVFTFLEVINFYRLSFKVEALHGTYSRRTTTARGEPRHAILMLDHLWLPSTWNERDGLQASYDTGFSSPNQGFDGQVWCKTMDSG